MKLKLQFASLLTLGILGGFVFTILLTLAFFFNAISWQILIGLTIFFNFLMWLISPYLSDLMYKWFYKMQFYDPEKLMHYPYMKFVKKVCDEHKIKVPKIGIIQDENPTAFTYGSGAFNARIILTEGLFKFLNEDELEAVLAHELGHIINKDFIIMTIATTLLDVLYEVYVICTKSRNQSASFGKRGGKKGDGQAIFYLIGIVSYIFYVVGTYIVLFLSRLREYYADEFAAKKTHPDHLSSALIKIAYGIASVPDTQKTAHLLNNTRAQGIFDFKAANEVGLVFLNSKEDKKLMEKALTFDLVNPWAFIFELSSTHPLVGKRIKRLCCMSEKKTFEFDTQHVDKGKIWSHFFTDLAVKYSTTFLFIGYIIGLAYQFIAKQNYFLVSSMAFFGLLVVLQYIKVSYMFPSGFKESDVLTLMADPYASPVRGRPVKLNGKAIGRGTAGYIFGEDMIFQDKKGIIYLNYESGIPLFGNLIFAWKKLETLLNKDATASGWFFRGATHHIELSEFVSGSERIKSYVKFWTVFGIVIVLGIVGLILFFIIPRIGLS
jgi:Zn-dependent protease with chaperone function